MLSISDYDVVNNAIYGSYLTKMNGLVSSIYINNADEYTGVSATEGYLRSAIAENQALGGNISDGIDLVEKNREYINMIYGDLNKMLLIAEDFARGGLTAQEITDKQAEFEAFAADIDSIAEGPLGEIHLLTSDNHTESISIGSGLSVVIDTHDMDTTSGLGLGTVDLAVDADAAVAAVEAAIAEVQAYSAHLDTKYDSLQAAQAAIEVQSQSLLAVQSAVGSIDAALMVVGAINAKATATTGILMVAQANATTDTVMQLLAD